MVHGPSSGISWGLCSNPALPFTSSATFGESLTLSKRHFAPLCENVSFSCSHKLTLKQRFISCSEIYYYSLAQVGRPHSVVTQVRALRSHQSLQEGGDSYGGKHQLYASS